MTPFQKETFQIQSLCLLYLITLYCVGIVLHNFLFLFFFGHKLVCKQSVIVGSVFYAMKVMPPVLPLTAMGEIQIPGGH